MVIKDLLTGNTATGGGNLNVGAIGASLYTPLQLTGTGNVTSLRLSYWRNGVIPESAVTYRCTKI